MLVGLDPTSCICHPATCDCKHLKPMDLQVALDWERTAENNGMESGWKVGLEVAASSYSATPNIAGASATKLLPAKVGGGPR